MARTDGKVQNPAPVNIARFHPCGGLLPVESAGIEAAPGGAKLPAESRPYLAPQAWETLEDPIRLCKEYWNLTGPLLMTAEGRARKRSENCAGTPESVRYGLAKTSPRVVASLGDWDLRQELGAVTATTLVLHGEQDLFPLEGAREWAASIPGVRLLTIPGAGHAPHLERPDLFFPAMDAFLAGGWPEGASR